MVHLSIHAATGTQVALKGIYDLQLTEVLARRNKGHTVRYVMGFGKVMSADAL